MLCCPMGMPLPVEEEALVSLSDGLLGQREVSRGESHQSDSRGRKSSGLHLRTVSHSSELPLSSPIRTQGSWAPPTGRGEKGGPGLTWLLESSPGQWIARLFPSELRRPSRRDCNCNGHRGESREETVVSLHFYDPG